MFWLTLEHRYDTSLSLGFGRPHVSLSSDGARDYLNLVRKLGPSSIVDPTAATYVVSLVELSTVRYFHSVWLSNADYVVPDFYRLDHQAAPRAHIDNTTPRSNFASCHCMVEDLRAIIGSEPTIGRMATPMDLEW